MSSSFDSREAGRIFLTSVFTRIAVAPVDPVAPADPLERTSLYVSSYMAPREFPFPCAICIEVIHANERVSTAGRCLHTFHEKCLGEWTARNASCPTCRTSFSTAGPS